MNKKTKGFLKSAAAMLLVMIMVISSLRITASAATTNLHENNVPVLYQTSYTKTICVIDGENKSVKSSGCGATSASMVIRYYTNNTTQNPETLFTWAWENGYYNGDGLSHDTVSKLCSNYGVTCTWEDEMDKVVAAIKNGQPVIAHMGPGTFTSGGHYIVLTGYKIVDGVEKIRVNDPNSSTRTGKYYDLDLIYRERRAVANPFGICSYSGTTSKMMVSPSLATTTITKGNSCNISGTVSSNYAITKVVGSILNASGTTVQTKTIYPNRTSVALSSSAINSSLKFGTLAAGSYKLKVTATDARGTSATKIINFTVKNPVTSTLSVSASLATTTITKGNSCNISGTVSSNYAIKSVVGKIVNSSGTAVQTVTISPNATSVSLYSSNINKNLKFGSLAAGSYKLTITATDTSGKVITKTISFTVKNASAVSTLSVAPTLAATSITKGNSCNISGTVKSNYKITKVVGSIVNSSGSAVQTVTIAPNTTSVSLYSSSINKNLRFGTLAKGSYTLKVTATDASGKVVTATRSFTIK